MNDHVGNLKAKTNIMSQRKLNHVPVLDVYKSFIVNVNSDCLMDEYIIFNVRLKEKFDLLEDVCIIYTFD